MKAKFKWMETLEKHLKIIKDRLCSDRPLVPFDTKRKSRVYCDASPYRTQTTVAQRYEEDGEVRWRPVANTARSWSEVEARYGQVERESNRVLHSITSNKMYVLGQEFVCVVDYKPLLPLYNQLKRPIQARVDRHRMKLAQFNFKLVYEKGSMNPCDYGSRHPGKHCGEEDDSEIYINRGGGVVTSSSYKEDDEEGHGRRHAAPNAQGRYNRREVQKLAAQVRIGIWRIGCGGWAGGDRQTVKNSQGTMEAGRDRWRKSLWRPAGHAWWQQPGRRWNH